MNKIICIPLFLFSFNCYSSVKVKYLNQRFMWIETSSDNVRVSLNPQVDGISLYSIDVKTSEEQFSFVLRRACPYKSCLKEVLELRKFIKKNNVVEIIGYPSIKEKIGSYSALWELIRGATGCIGYFSECEKFEIIYPEWNEWKKDPIDPNIYP